jgi:hypothetical protein
MKKAIHAENLTAQLQYRAAGNPPSTMPAAAISNAYPGLEMDFRNAWRRVLVGIELHEATNVVVGVDASAPASLHVLPAAYQLMKVQDQPVTVTVTGPLVAGGPDGPLPKAGPDSVTNLEWSNALADILHRFSGKEVECEFQRLDPPFTNLTFNLQVRHFFERVELPGGKSLRLAVIARDIAEPGALTQSLCSPWQNDYRECACFYWAASRPDFVNVEIGEDGASVGNNWMQKDRTPETARVYIVDDRHDERLLTYGDLFRAWEGALRFVIGNQDAE